MTQNARSLLVAAVVLASCGSEVAGSRTTFAFSGTSFAGEAPLYQRYVGSEPTLPTAFSVRLTDSLRSCGAATYTVDLYVPAAVYEGPGRYACGTDFGGSYPALCTITVMHIPDCVAVGEWSTWDATRPDGSYGELPGCSITVEQDDTVVRGTATCAGLVFRALAGTHPDAGKKLAMSGRFYAER